MSDGFSAAGYWCKPTDFLTSRYFALIVSLGIVGFLTAHAQLRKWAKNGQKLTSKRSLERFLEDVERSYQQDQLSKTIERSIVQDETTTKLKVPEILNVYEGFQGSVHHVHTKDGYILELHRLRSSTKKVDNSFPVVLQHGLLSDSSNWVLNGADKRSLGFALAERGHDVWLANSRGNDYSRRHEEFDPDSNPGPFWNFTWYEMAIYDIPATIDYILSETDSPKLHYCGHSQGNLIMFTALDILGEDIKHKLASFHALAPIVFMKNMPSPMRYFANSILATPIIYKKWPEEILPRNKLGLWISDLLGKFIGNQGVPNMLTLLFGFHPKRYVLDKMTTYFTHIPAGTSFQDILHFAQIIRKNKLQTFQVGRHGETTDITLENIRDMTDMYFYVGQDDEFSDYTDVNQLEDLLVAQGNEIIRKNIDDYDHLCFIWGSDAYFHVYSDIIKVVETKLREPCSDPFLPSCRQI